MLTTDLKRSRTFLFWTCFIALIATSFGFISRVFMLGDWGREFGLSETQVELLPAVEQQRIERIRGEAKRAALFKVAILPAIMLLTYLGLIIYFKLRGGYRQIHLTEGLAAPVD